MSDICKLWEYLKITDDMIKTVQYFECPPSKPLGDFIISDDGRIGIEVRM